MEALRLWLSGVAVVTMLISVAQILVPEGTLRQMTGFIGGLVLLLVLARPLLGGALRDLTPDFSAYERAEAEAQARLEDSARQEMAAIIEEKTASYILDKAEALGQTGRVRVFTEPDGEGVPVPVRVELDAPYSRELSQWIETEIGLGAERQVWNGTKN